MRGTSNEFNEGRFWRHCALLLSAYQPDRSIPKLLGAIGRSHRADRAWIIRYNFSFTRFWNAYEWCQSGIKAHGSDLQGIPVEMAAWLHESLLRNESVQIEDTARMPRRARTLQVEFRRQGIRSLLAVPIFWRGRLVIQIGYDATDRLQSWSSDEIEQLRQLGRLIANRILVKQIGVESSGRFRTGGDRRPRFGAAWQSPA